MTACLLLLAAVAADPLGPGNHERKLTVDGRERSYLIHIPAKYDAAQKTPVVLVLHGAGMNAAMMVGFSGMNKKSDEAGFIAAYPNGTGIGPLCTFNCGGVKGKLAEFGADDVKYVGALLDDLQTVTNVDAQRVFATGMSNGGMMSYRLAAEMSDRIAAIAPVGGTLCQDECNPRRPVPVLHFHGTEDTIVPFDGPRDRAAKFVTFKSVDDSLAAWRKVNGCPAEPTITEFADKEDDGTQVIRKCYGPGKQGAEVVLIEITGGGHTWPGRSPPVSFIGKSTRDIAANDLIWEFFEKHALR